MTDATRQMNLAMLGIVLVALLIAATFLLLPAAVSLHGFGFSWQLNKDLIPPIMWQRQRLLGGLLAVLIAALCFTAWAGYDKRLSAAQRELLFDRAGMAALLAIVLPMFCWMMVAWMNAPTHGWSIMGSYEPDSWMRLVMVRQLLEGGGWYNHIVEKGNAPFGGIANHWTRPLDLAIALVVWVQGHTPINLALVRAGIFLPWVWTTSLLFALVNSARKLGAQLTAPLILTACFAADLVFWTYFMVGNADHHAPLAALFAWSVSLLIGTPSQREATIAGFLLALMLWISPEATALIGGLYAFFGIRWLLMPQAPSPLKPLSFAVAMGVAAAMLIERPPSLWFVASYDVIAIPYAVLMLLCAALAEVLTTLPPMPLLKRACIAALGAAAALGLEWLVYPLIFQGPMAATDAFIRTYFLPTLYETQPIWHRPPIFILTIMWQPLFAMVGGIWLAMRDKRALLPLFLVFFTAVLYCVQFRWCYYFYPSSFLMLAVAIDRFMADKQDWSWRAVSAGILIALFLVTPPLRRQVPQESPSQLLELACEKQAHQWMESGALDHLDGDRSLIVEIGTEIGPPLMFWTPHRIIAANYHRESEGMQYVWHAADITDEQTLHQYLAVRQVDALLICRKWPENSLLGELRAGQTPPSWLKRVDLPVTTAPESTPALFLVMH